METSYWIQVPYKDDLSYYVDVVFAPVHTLCSLDGNNKWIISHPIPVFYRFDYYVKKRIKYV